MYTVIEIDGGTAYTGWWSQMCFILMNCSAQCHYVTDSSVLSRTRCGSESMIILLWNSHTYRSCIATNHSRIEMVVMYLARVCARDRKGRPCMFMGGCVWVYVCVWVHHVHQSWTQEQSKTWQQPKNHPHKLQPKQSRTQEQQSKQLLHQLWTRLSSLDFKA